MSSKNKKANCVIGIDLGTTNSAAAVYEADGDCRMIPNAEGKALTPSEVNYQDESHPLVGEPAVNQRAFAPECAARLFKRHMGRQDNQGNPIPVLIHPVSSRAYSAEQPSGCVLRYLARSAEDSLAARVAGAVVTVPAYFEDPARVATRQAGELAGLRVLALVNEPTAAGIAYGLDRAEHGIFAVFDLGGGTFDITILQIQNREFRALATSGDRDLGGSDIDNLILERARATLEAEHGIRLTAETDLATWLELLDKSESLKKVLSQSETASFMVSCDGKRSRFDLSRDAFNAMIAPIVQKTRAITEKALEAAHLQPRDITDVILVGGSTRIPAVRTMLRNLFGKDPRADINPDEAVAMGAAIFASRAAADAEIQVVDREGTPVLPPPINVVDVNSHPLGCLVNRNGEELNFVIIPANTPLPAEKEEAFGLLHPDQTEAKVTILQGAHLASPGKCVIIGEVVLSGIPKGWEDKTRIRVRYGFTAEGTLSITVTDTVSGRSTSDIRRGLSGFVGQASQS